ncbi:MAG: hypothetical protein GY795_05815 [Desulfobacterales bacterium]|nr:hypothetical protein [Desulfobacterales bacterium]
MDFLKWLFRILLSPILVPLYFAIGFIKEFFSFMFSGLIQFVISVIPPTFIIVVAVLSIKVAFILITQYLSFDFDFSEYCDSCGGYIDSSSSTSSSYGRMGWGNRTPSIVKKHLK